MFHDGPIEGVIVTDLPRRTDERGWLIELFRHDDLPSELVPEMAYISATEPGVARGPHEHIHQTDIFVFIGPSDFCVYLWDGRQRSPTFRRRMKLVVGQSRPARVVIPPGVVHAYKNIGDAPGLSVNCPNRLYGGPGRSGPIDEIRHEQRTDNPYVLD
jgi:dTDP-4-dehydrorhamnose 3,5-epimerase